jgi:hypothetical protein
VTFPETREQAAAYLIRGAARHALFRLGGQTEDSLLEVSRADLRQCQLLDPDTRPTEKAFSPAFLEFFRQSR